MLLRLTSLISHLAVSLAERDAALRQAVSASHTAETLLKQDKAEKEEEKQKEANVSNEIKELQEGKQRTIVISSYFTFHICFEFSLHSFICTLPSVNEDRNLDIMLGLDNDCLNI